jgi:nuclear RNA export factor
MVARTRERRRGGDRDGDIAMGVSIKGRAGITKAPPTGPRKDLTARASKGGILSATAQREILRKAGRGDVSMKEARLNAPARGGLVELKVSGWSKSKASSNADGGVSSLTKWLEKKASTKLGSSRRDAKIHKMRTEGSDLFIKIPPEDAGAFLRLNTWQWAGINVGIERVGGAVQDAKPSSEAEQIKVMLRGVLERRYDADTKFLNLSALGQDEELKKQHIFDQKSTAAKFFPAMMRVLELSFDKPEERDAAVISVSLANNDLADLTAVSSLSQTLPKLQNLDLSNNKFNDLSALMTWRKRFLHLRHLILAGNPLELNEPNYQRAVINWYPNLLQLNGVQVRTEEEIANKSAANTTLPFPIRSPIFQDEGGIAETFVRNLIAGFDSDRAALATAYYDAQSEFSYSINTHAPSDPAGTARTEKGDWDPYLKDSRNLKKISHLPARQNRLFTGTQAIAGIFARLPKTKHPDLATEARKWLIEAKMIPNVPDITGQSSQGVDGFKITIHGEFEEPDLSKKRSFDRAIVLGPGNGPGGVRLVNDVFTIRAYGGAQAFEPDNMEGWNQEVVAVPAQAPTAADGVPQLPAGITIEIAEQMVAELMKQTNMTLEYAKMCLEQSSWNFALAGENFGRAKDSLPPEAFVQQAPVG